MTAPVYVDCSAAMHALLTPARLAAVPGLRIHEGDPAPAELPAIIGDAARVLNGHTVMDAALFAALPALERIVFLGTGAASYIDLDAAAAHGIEVRTIKGYGDRSVAEHALALMFAAARQVAAQDAALKRGEWVPQVGTELSGATLGVIGAGGIGAEMISLGAALGLNLIAYARTPPDNLPATFMPLDDVLAKADIVSLHLALTAETTGLIDADALARMKQGAILVNTARGALVDETALIAALQSEHLAHAALDVFAEEPLGPGAPLLAAPNVTLTPHVAYKTPGASVRLLEAGLALLAE
ncbi:NAD(P)-dependent oxidoreductase [Acuticoccus sp. MNP-M23]|uniref:2-hydroxyacid dehydrogenase n=1 Tax=Acuticoccus sp. MNP-M23 TaxID=3072793 RepID=UPI00281605B7|nr:NAD(P)-dependent oxidoreductase [Acuticoccus sp. MNP-M23]WMS41524.1 NAD(P)-dependent oxidoreductase [Acuticoccus sp. MNP-M23]